MTTQRALYLVLFATVAGSGGSAFADQADFPEGLNASDWSGICAAHEANRHAAYPVKGNAGVGPVYQARNPGQRWRTIFDARGILTMPDAGDWTWGLELLSYGRGGEERATTRPACVDAQRQRVEDEWDKTLTEWYVNDARGLEHGYTVHQRPDSSALLAERSGGPFPEAEATGNHRAPCGRRPGCGSGRKHGCDSVRRRLHVVLPL